MTLLVLRLVPRPATAAARMELLMVMKRGILIAGTRVLLGAGLALLISNKLSAEQRQTAGAVLTAVGVLTTIPLAAEALGK